MKNSMFLEDWQSELKGREQTVVGNILKSVNDDSCKGAVEMNHMGISELDEDALMTLIGKTWNNMNSAQDPKKKELFKQQLELIKVELKKRR